MSGKIISVPQAAHRCEGKPDPRSFTPGTVWQCDDCDKKWVAVAGTQYNENYYAWRVLTDSNKDGRDN